jgi:hypothetical protein
VLLIRPPGTRLRSILTLISTTRPGSGADGGRYGGGRTRLTFAEMPLAGDQHPV